MPALQKRPVDPQRVRHVPRQFGAVDRRLVYSSLVRALSPLELALYLVLICVSDPEGLSYYSDRKLAEMLEAPASMIVAARDGLIRRGLILYGRPMYQLLDLPV